MMRSILLVVMSVTCLTLVWSQDLLTPDEFLPQQYGHDFVPYHLKIAYLEHVAEVSPLVELAEYGRTEERRPLVHAYISTAANLARLEEIRLDNLRRVAGEPRALEDDIAIVMLGYSVHGNEAAGSEAALTTLYKLADPTNARTKEWLQNTVIIVDPCLNPDGHARYVDWYTRTANKVTDVTPSSIEHREPWPGGRTNHYYFDLNRDWAWQTQVESQARVKQYRRWMPQIHVDLHEMGINSPYYFAPAAQPYHEYITEWQVDFQDIVGRNNAKYFDEEGWLYFTKEVFDLFYPAYGDTYPTYNGAIGMTYEQGGSGRAGSAVLMDNGDTLTLQDRIDHHVQASMSTIEMGSVHASRLLSEFTSYFERNRREPQGEYVTYVISGSSAREKLKAVSQLLTSNDIAYGTVDRASRVTAYHYQTGKDTSYQIVPGDLVVSAYQTQSTLTQVLFDPLSNLSDSLTYDITAWSLPHMFGVPSYASKQRIRPTDTFVLPERVRPEQSMPYAYLIPWEASTSARLLASLVEAGVKIRLSEEAITTGGRSFAPGTLIITRADNKILGDRLNNLMRDLLERHDHSAYSTESGYSEAGPDLGSNKLSLLARPQVLVLAGDGVNSYAFGQVWHYFEKVLGYPVSISRLGDFAAVDLDKYNVLVLPSGRYSSLRESQWDDLTSWISSGGKVIAMGAAVGQLASQSGFEIKRLQQEEDEETEEAPRIYQDRIGASISQRTPGAIVQTTLDNSHPLGYGFPPYYFSLKSGNATYDRLSNGWNVGHISEDPLVLGFSGAKFTPKLIGSVTYAVQPKGRGSVIYLVDNPLFRGFWENGQQLFANALFFVGN